MNTDKAHEANAARNPEYEEAKRRLAAYVSTLKASQNFTTQRNEAEEYATRIEKLASELGGDSLVLWDVESAHDEPPAATPGPDGRAVSVPVCGASFKATIGYMRDLAYSFRLVAAAYPDPRTKFALPAAALGLVAIWYEHRKPRPSLYADGEAAKELAELCNGIGIVLGPESYKGALSKAMKSFDPTYLPPWVHHVMTGRWEW